MIEPTTTLVVRSDELVHETVDGEVVVVDLANGVYFSTDGVGAAVWARLVGGTTIDGLADWARAAYPDHDAAPAEVSTFVQQLHAQRLVVVTEADPVVPTDEPPPPMWSTPDVQAFDDMESLLLLDPIHDVEPEAGWPHPV